MHGVGQRFGELAFEAFNLPPFVSVKEQVILLLFHEALEVFSIACSEGLPSFFKTLSFLSSFFFFKICLMTYQILCKNCLLY